MRKKANFCLATVLAYLAVAPADAIAKSIPCGVVRAANSENWFATVRTEDGTDALAQIGERPDWSAATRLVISTCVGKVCLERAIMPPSADFTLEIVDSGVLIHTTDAVELLSDATGSPGVAVSRDDLGPDPSRVARGPYLRFSRESCVVPSPFAVISLQSG